MSKEQVGELLEGDNIQEIIKDSISGSMIPNDPIGILEQIWDQF
jgi:hypothetical protein